MSIIKKILSVIEEYIQEKRLERMYTGPCGYRHYICSKCGKMELSTSRPSREGCREGEHKWEIMKVEY